jgi:hypothetical protein
LVVRCVKVFRSLSKFVLHPLIHALLEFTLARDIVSSQGFFIQTTLGLPEKNSEKLKALRFTP